MSPSERLSRRFIVALAGAALSGLLQVLIFPRFSWDWLAPVCLVPLLLVLKGLSLRERLAAGLFAGAICWAGTCYWVYAVMRDYAGIAPPVAGLLYIGAFLVMAVQSGAFGILAGQFLRWPWAVPAIAALWVTLDGTYQYVLFTWTQLGNVAVDFPLPQVLRLAPWTGIYGPSLVFALANAAIAVAILRRSYRPLLALVPLAGLALLPPLPEPGPQRETARLVQPNVHPDLIKAGWLAENGTAHLARMLEMSKAAAAGDQPSLLVWPEYPVSAYYYDDPASRAFLERVARESGAAFIFNTISFEDGDRSRPQNSSVTLDRNGERLSSYSKIRLVPFGEYVPWPFHLFVEKITMQAGVFQPGKQISVAPVADRGIGTFICYESVFADSIRKFTRNGAELLVNISNDSWYGRSAAREQHLLVARMRAIENGRWLLRATNDGVTSAIDPAGRVVAALPSYVQDSLDVRFDYRSDLTAFVRYGEWLWWLCLISTAIMLAGSYAMSRRSGLP